MEVLLGTFQGASWLIVSPILSKFPHGNAAAPVQLLLHPIEEFSEQEFSWEAWGSLPLRKTHLPHRSYIGPQTYASDNTDLNWSILVGQAGEGGRIQCSQQQWSCSLPGPISHPLRRVRIGWIASSSPCPSPPWSSPAQHWPAPAGASPVLWLQWEGPGRTVHRRTGLYSWCCQKLRLGHLAF